MRSPAPDWPSRPVGSLGAQSTTCQLHSLTLFSLCAKIDQEEPRKVYKLGAVKFSLRPPFSKAGEATLNAMESVHISGSMGTVCLPECLRDENGGCHSPIVCCDMCPPDCEEASETTICPEASALSACTYQPASNVTDHHSSSHSHVCNSPRMRGNYTPSKWDLDADDEALFLDEDPVELGEKFSRRFCCSRDWCWREPHREPCHESFRAICHPSSCMKESNYCGEESCADSSDCGTSESTPNPFLVQLHEDCCPSKKGPASQGNFAAVESNEQPYYSDQPEEKNVDDPAMDVPPIELCGTRDKLDVARDSDHQVQDTKAGGVTDSADLDISQIIHDQTPVGIQFRTHSGCQVKAEGYSQGTSSDITHTDRECLPFDLERPEESHLPKGSEHGRLDQAQLSYSTPFGSPQSVRSRERERGPLEVTSVTQLRTPEVSPPRIENHYSRPFPDLEIPRQYNWKSSSLSRPWIASNVPTMTEMQASGSGDLKYTSISVPHPQSMINHTGLSPLTDQFAIHTSALPLSYTPLTPITSTSISPTRSPHPSSISTVETMNAQLHQHNRKRHCSPADESPCPRNKVFYRAHPRLGSSRTTTEQRAGCHDAEQLQGPLLATKHEERDKGEARVAHTKNKGWPCRYPWEHPGDSLVTFADASNRRKHEQSHWQMAPYGCYHQPKCKTRIARSDDAKRHLVEGGCRVHRALHPSAPKGKNGKPELPLPPDFDDRRREEFKKAREKEDEFYIRRKKEWLESGGKMP